jgi:hypothetical protein
MQMQARESLARGSRWNLSFQGLDGKEMARNVLCALLIALIVAALPAIAARKTPAKPSGGSRPKPGQVTPSGSKKARQVEVEPVGVAPIVPPESDPPGMSGRAGAVRARAADLCPTVLHGHHLYLVVILKESSVSPKPGHGKVTLKFEEPSDARVLVNSSDQPILFGAYSGVYVHEVELKELPPGKDTSTVTVTAHGIKKGDGPVDRQTSFRVVRG